jgi:hypothetical protein
MDEDFSKKLVPAILGFLVGVIAAAGVCKVMNPKCCDPADCKTKNCCDCC